MAQRCTAVHIPAIRPERLIHAPTIGKYLGKIDDWIEVYEKYQLVNGEATRTCGSVGECADNWFPMKISKTPNIKIGVDIVPAVYGYVHMPDGFFPKINPLNWTVAMLFAAGVGPSIGATLGPGGTLWGAEKDLLRKE